MSAERDRQLWRAGDVECWMISCCTGAELRVSRGDDVLLRELYPTKSDLYERAALLRGTYERTAHESEGDLSRR
jgi:hypothetical protein